jgi:hypothetical protein
MTTTTDKLKYFLASDKGTITTTLEELASDSDWRIRREVASNPSTPLSALKRLATDECWYVRKSLISNSSATFEVLDLLKNDPEPIYAVVVEELLRLRAEQKP